MTTGAALHVIFGASARGSLEQALSQAGRSERAICPFDNFSFGPIAGDDGETRAEWVRETLHYDWESAVAGTAPFLAECRSSASPPIVWVNFREAASYAGFLWWLCHMGNLPCSVVHVPDLSLRNAGELLSFLNLATLLTVEDRAHRHDQWQRLKREDSPLRIVVGNDLISAPLTQFDAVLLGLASPEWQRMALIVGRALVATSEDGIYQVGDIVLSACLGDLAEAGALEWHGDLSDMRNCELRLPA